MRSRSWHVRRARSGRSAWRRPRNDRRDELGVGLRPVAIQQRLDASIASAREAVGSEYDAHWATGASLTLEGACAYALRGRGERKRPSHGWSSLTPTEVEVVDLVAAGLTNPQIAERLFVETSTVKTHLHHIFTKLGVTNRASSPPRRCDAPDLSRRRRRSQRGESPARLDAASSFQYTTREMRFNSADRHVQRPRDLLVGASAPGQSRRPAARRR